MSATRTLIPLIFAFAATAGTAHAKDALHITLTIHDHRFSPSQIDLPASTPVELQIRNLDADPEEFDSKALKVEQVIPGGQTGKIRLRPLPPGSYPFVGEFHADTAQGVVVVK